MVYRFATGGLENVIVQLINGLPHGDFRHTVVALTSADQAFVARIERKDVEVLVLNKAPGQPFGLYPSVYRLLRKLRPDVLHTCNLAALEFMPVAWLARVPMRIHAEHGWDVRDPDGSNRSYQRLRRLYRPFVHGFIAVSAPIADYLARRIHVDRDHIRLISNGVDLAHFRPHCADDPLPDGYPFIKAHHCVIGTVGRQEPIKNPLLLVEAFIDLVHAGGQQSSTLRLVMIGDGSLHEQIDSRMQQAGLRDRLWLPGNRDDVAEIMRCLDCFVLPSISEGTSCTLQEALATGLPVIATDVGGSRAALDDGRAGRLVPSQDKGQLLAAIQDCLSLPGLSKQARKYAEVAHDLKMTMSAYEALFKSRCWATKRG